MIQVSQLTKSYGDRQAIQDLNFSVNSGEVVGFLGPNGAGKSTTMKIITGFMAPTSGVAKVAGIDVFERPIEVKKRIGYLPETPPIYGDMFVSDFLRFVAELKQVPSEKIKSRVEYALQKTSLQDVAHRLIQNLSKGYRQRVGIAQALVSDPEVLILDEPTVGLDPKQVAEIRDLIKSLKGQHTIILSTHILPEVQAVCEKIIIIHQGRIVAQDSIEHLSHLEKGHLRVHVKTAVTADLKAMLSHVNGIHDIQPLSGKDAGWSIDYVGGNDSLAHISKEIVNKDLGLLLLEPQVLNLEDVFLKLTYDKNKLSDTNKES